MNCYYHPDREVVGMCVSCGKPICAECKVVLEEKFYCNPCVYKIYSGRAEAGAAVAENTSGQGKLAVVPREVKEWNKGWNWGAFLLGWIWSVCHNVWIGLLSLVPFAGIIMDIILGVKGNEWAWRYRRWDSVEHFKSTQRKWGWWGAGVSFLGFVIGFIAAMSGYW